MLFKSAQGEAACLQLAERLFQSFTPLNEKDFLPFTVPRRFSRDKLFCTIWSEDRMVPNLAEFLRTPSVFVKPMCLSVRSYEPCLRSNLAVNELVILLIISNIALIFVLFLYYV